MALVQRTLILALLLGVGVQSRAEPIARTFPEELAVTLNAETLKEMDEFWVSLGTDLDESFDERIENIRAQAKKPSQDLLSMGPHSLEKALFWMSAVPRGRGLLARVAPLWQTEAGKKGLHFESSLSPAGLRLNQGPESLAFFHKDTIYLNHQFPFLVLLGSLFHEAIHAEELLCEEGGSTKQKALDLLINLDEQARTLKAKIKTADAAKEALDPRVREYLEELTPLHEESTRIAFPLLIAMEHRAYRSQDTFLGELIALDASFKEGLRVMVQQRRWLEYPISEALFRKLMQYERGFNLPKPVVDAYFEKVTFDHFR